MQKCLLIPLFQHCSIYASLLKFGVSCSRAGDLTQLSRKLFQPSRPGSQPEKVSEKGSRIVMFSTAVRSKKGFSFKMPQKCQNLFLLRFWACLLKNVQQMSNKCPWPARGLPHMSNKCQKNVLKMPQDIVFTFFDHFKDFQGL